MPLKRPPTPPLNDDEPCPTCGGERFVEDDGIIAQQFDYEVTKPCPTCSAPDAETTAVSAMMTPAEAEELGLTIDTHCYPWFAYRGPRFAPTEGHNCLTNKEAGAVGVMNRLLDEKDDLRSRHEKRLRNGIARIINPNTLT